MNTTQQIGRSPTFMRVVHAARMVAVADTTVLLLGEKGVGKRHLGREIHHLSYRRSRPFIVLPCASVNDRHAFSATFEGVAGGTLYLDNVGELSLPAQAQLQAYCETQDEKAKVEEKVRIIASSSVDLKLLVDGGQFREDLYYRLYVVPLTVPPLRERREDIPLFIKQFLREIAGRSKRRVPSFTLAAKKLLKRYPWPGNLRELHNLCERMVVIHAGESITPELLPGEIVDYQAGTGQLGFKLPQGGINLLELESEVIRQALQMAKGNRSKAARLLGITRDTLLYRIQKHAITL